MAPSRYDWKIVDWDVKPQHNQPTNKRNGRTCKFQYQWLEIFGRLEEIYIEAIFTFLKCFSIITQISYVFLKSY